MTKPQDNDLTAIENELQPGCGGRIRPVVRSQICNDNVINDYSGRPESVHSPLIGFLGNGFLNRPLAGARSRARRTRRTAKTFLLALRTNKTCFSWRSWRSWRFVIYFLNRPLAALAQAREGREGRRKDLFFWPFGPIKHAFLGGLGGLGGSFFFCSSVFEPPARYARSRTRRTRRHVFLALRANKKMLFLAVLAALAVHSF